MPDLRSFLPEGFPKIVTLCGSTRFADAYRDALASETLAGNIVLSVGLLGHQTGLDMNGPTKAALDQLHFRKIELSDEILVLNVITGVCSKCGKIPSNSWSTPSDSWTGCCNGKLLKKAYIGESTRNEIAHATKLGKVVRYLEAI